jgi:hypothetical protein
MNNRLAVGSILPQKSFAPDPMLTGIAVIIPLLRPELGVFKR